MKLEQQVCSLELAKKLKELGVKQESLYVYWQKTDGSGSPRYPYERGEGYRLIEKLDNLHPFDESFSAFTVAELGEMLPARIEKDNKTFQLEMSKGGFSWDEFFLEYVENNSRNPELEVQRNADTEADARCLMLCYLMENRLI